MSSCINILNIIYKYTILPSALVEFCYFFSKKVEWGFYNNRLYRESMYGVRHPKWTYLLKSPFQKDEMVEIEDLIKELRNNYIQIMQNVVY